MKFEPINSLEQELGISVPEFTVLDQKIKLGYRRGVKDLEEDNRSIVELKLSDIELEHIPTNLQHHHNLKTLVLSHNKLSEADLSILKDNTSLRTLDLSCNKITSLDLSPLLNCQHLTSFNISNNKLRELDLEIFKNNKSLTSLDLQNNEIAELDITNLIDCPNLGLIRFDDNTKLFSSPMKRDSSHTFSDFLRFNLHRINWKITGLNDREKNLYEKYHLAAKYFYTEELWLNFLERRGEKSVQSDFFDRVVKIFYENLISHSLNAEKEPIDQKTLPSTYTPLSELLPKAKKFWKSNIRVKYTITDGLNNELLIVKPWPEINPHTRERHHLFHFMNLVTSFSWVRISENKEKRNYKAVFGFNGGYIQHGKPYNPFIIKNILQMESSFDLEKFKIEIPLKIPPDVVYTIEALFECKVKQSSNINEIMQEVEKWFETKHQTATEAVLNRRWAELHYDI